MSTYLAQSTLAIPSSLVVIDSTVQDYRSLVQGVLSNTEVVVLSPKEDGVEKITRILPKFPALTTLHLVSHGFPACVQVGCSKLNLDTLKAYASQLKTWSVDSILLYGCNVAAGDAGAEFIDKLHYLTGAEIAASANRTGSAALGGDWKLEVTTGDFKAFPVFQSEAMQAYASVLVAPDLDLDGDDSSGETGNDFQNIFIPGGSGVRVVDLNTPSNEGSDTVITDSDSTQLSGATITLTNAQTGDELNIGTLPGGITSNTSNTGSEIVVTLSGNASFADYEAALEAITFNNTESTPDIATRNIDVQVTDAASEISNTATSSIAIEAGEVLIAATAAPTITGTGVGRSALWEDVANYDGTSIDIRATVIALDSGTSAPNFSTNSNDLRISTRSGGAFTLRWDLINAATGDPVISDINFAISDIDGPNIEAVSANLDDIDAYTLNDPTNLAPSVSNNFITLAGTQSQNGEVESAVRLNWLGVSSFEVAYSASESGRFFEHDGNLEFLFANPVTVATPKVDLDASNRATGFDFATTFASEGSAVAIADTDTSISDAQNTTLASTTITLTNAQAGDELSIAGTLPAGITSSVSSANGQIVLSLTGSASLADYEAAIEAVRFNNPLSGPSREDRRIEISVNNGSADSNLAVSTVSITDNTPPSVTSIARQTPADEITNADSVVFRVNLDEGVQNVDTSDFVLSGSAAAEGTISEVTQVSSDVYDITVTGINNSNGTVNLDFASTQNITDEVGNPLSGTEPSTDESYTLDNISPAAPTVDSQATQNTTPTITGTATVDSGEALTVVVGGVTYTVGDGNLTLDGTNWSLTIPDADTLAEGTYEVEATVTDAAGNATSDGTSNELVVDSTAPAAPTVSPMTTSDTTPTIEGTANLEDGETLAVVVNEVTYTAGDGNLTFDGANWSLTIPDADTLAEGTYEVEATVTDAAGNATDDTTSSELIVDTTAPAAPTVSPLATSDTTPTIEGTANLEDGETLAVVVNEVTYTVGDGNLTLDGTNWSLTIPDADTLAEGTYEVEATVTDAAGNATSDNSTSELTIDITNPDAPTVNDLTTSSTIPTITGTANVGAGETLTVVVNEVTYTAGDGNLTLDGTDWSLTIPDANALAEGNYEIAATVTDEAENTISDTTSNELVVDTTAPAVPTIENLLTNNTTPTITGTANVGAGETFTVAVNGVIYTLGDGNLTLDGTDWTLNIPDENPLAAGTYEIAATIIDEAGNASSDSTSDELVLDTTAPAAPSLDLLAASDTGASDTDNLTNISTPTIQIALNGTDGEAPVAGDTVRLFSDSTEVGSAILTAENIANGFVNITTADLGANGDRTLIADITDGAGNATDSPPLVLTLDQTLPVLENAAVDGSTLTLTYDEPLNSSISPAVGDYSVIVNGETREISTIDADGDTVTLTLASPVDARDTVTLDYTAGTNPVQDEAGNEVSALTGQAVTNNTPDTTPPALQTAVANGNSITLTYDEPLNGDSDPAPEDYTVNVNGTAATVNSVDADGNTVTLTLENPVTNVDTVTLDYTAGTNPVQDVALNNAANLSDRRVTNSTGDTVAPAAPSLDLLAASDTGASDTDNLTSDGTPTIRVALNGTGAAAPVAGDTVRLFRNSTEVGSAILSAENITNGFVNITTADLGADGNKPLTANITDGANNTSANSAVLAVTLDRNEPTLQNAVVIDNTLTLTYNQALNNSAVPTAEDYQVSVNDETVGISSVEINGNTVTLTLNRPVDSAATVTLNYTSGTTPVQDRAGNEAANLANQTVSSNISDAPDSDRDGIVDLVDLDDDNDGIPDANESNNDTDRDGLIDALDLDSDNDGITDLRESGLPPNQIASLDPNDDGSIDFDSENPAATFGSNGLANPLETAADSGQIDYNGDGSLDEAADNDGDGVADFQDLDSDNDGVTDAVEQSGDPNRDTDGDGVLDFQDLDSDNDGITDATEAGRTDADRNGIIDGFTDADGDGLADEVESSEGDIPAPPDTDRDGIPDFQDRDSNNNGISDANEAGRTDADGDGVIDNFTDANGDGLADEVESSEDDIPAPPDNDGDGVPDFQDLDSDNDGIPDPEEQLGEPNRDTDGDGVPDFQDLDSDNDGITDAIEAGGTDADGDGILDNFTDADGDGLADAVDPSEGGTPLTPPDTDDDGVANFQDPNSDDDEFTDLVEANGIDADGDGAIDNFTDENQNGLADVVDPSQGGTPLTLLDANQDGVFDYLDPTQPLSKANNDTVTTSGGNSRTPTVIDVLDNDTVAEGLSLTITEFTQPSTGTITLDDNGTPDDPSDDRFRFTPGDTGENNLSLTQSNTPGLFSFGGDASAINDSFTYTVTDSEGNSSTATVNLTVEPQTRLKFTLANNQADFVNEIGLFQVDDENGTINGIAPGEEGYLEAALQSGRVIFSALGNQSTLFGDSPTRVMNGFSASDRLNFFLVQNSTVDTVLADLTAGREAPDVFFATPPANSDNVDHLQVSALDGGQLSLAFEDQTGRGDGDFNDLVLTIETTNELPPLGSNLQGEAAGELLDLTPQPNQTVQVEFSVEGESEYENLSGFYQLADAAGAVRDPLTGELIAPGEAGYADAALSQSVVEFGENGGGSTLELEGGTLYAPYLMADGEQAYFPFQEANPDQIDRVRLLGTNTFGFEDKPDGGDFDYNDLIFQANVTVV